jgi:hypothetical protein
MTTRAGCGWVVEVVGAAVVVVAIVVVVAMVVVVDEVVLEVVRRGGAAADPEAHAPRARASPAAAHLVRMRAIAAPG